MNTDYLVHILLLMLTAVLIENYIFSKFLGICPFLGVSEKPETALGMGFAVMFVMTISSAATWGVYHGISRAVRARISRDYRVHTHNRRARSVHRDVPQEIHTVALRRARHLSAADHDQLRGARAALLNIQNGYDLVESLAYGFSSAAGFTLAIVIFAGVRVRISFADPPKSFRDTDSDGRGGTDRDGVLGLLRDVVLRRTWQWKT